MSAESVLPTAEDKQRYDVARRELIQALMKKRQVDKQLAQLEVQLYNFEGSYLTETTAHSGGNIIQGFDAYLKTQSVGRRRHEVTDADRMFSNSSLTYQKSLELAGEGDDSDEHAQTGDATVNGGLSAITIPAAPGSVTPGGSRGPTPALTTVVLPPASRTQELSAAQQKKARDKEYQRRKRAAAAAANRTSAVSVSGDEEGSNSGRRPGKRPRPADDD